MGKKILTIIVIFLLLIVIFCGCVDVYERSPVEYIIISPDGKNLLSHDAELQLQLWEIKSEEELFRDEYQVGNIRWIMGGKEFLITGSNKIKIFNSTSFNEIWNCSGSFSYIDVNQDGLSLSTSVYSYNKNQQIYNITLWDLLKKEKKKLLNTSTKSSMISLSQSGERFVHIPLNKKSLEIINVSNENIIKNLSLDNQSTENLSTCYYLKWLDEDSKIAMVANFKNNGKYFYYWNVSNGEIILKKNYNYSMIYPSFSPDGMKFIMSSGTESPSNVSIVDITTGEVVYSLYLSEKGVSSTDWSPDGSLIAAGSNDGIIKVWNATTGDLVQTLLTPKDHRVPT